MKSYFFMLLCLVVMPLLTSPLLAQTKSLAKRVAVHVRMVDGSLEALADSKLDVRLSDVEANLSKFPYKHYRLIATKRAEIPVTKRRVLKLSGGHTLTLRPLYANKERSGLWIRWNDASGMEVIDSRMHFSGGEHLLTGLEINEKNGLVLAIRVEPLS